MLRNARCGLVVSEGETYLPLEPKVFCWRTRRRVQTAANQPVHPGDQIDANAGQA